MRKKITYEYDWIKTKYGFYGLIALIVLAFPAGLYFMWRGAKWKNWVKIAVSAAWGLVITAAVIIFCSTTLDYDMGNVQINAAVSGGRMLAPLPPEDLPDTSQLLRNASETSALISLPTPTPVPTMVYCNDNGVNYHLAGCRYVYVNKTPRVTLTQALNAGKTACKLCNPPKEETYGNNQ